MLRMLWCGVGEHIHEMLTSAAVWLDMTTSVRIVSSSFAPADSESAERVQSSKQIADVMKVCANESKLLRVVATD